MNLSNFKSIFIGILLVLAFYQTVQLWFGNFATYNFFYSMKEDEDLRQKENQKHITESIYVNLGEEKFIRRYNNIDKTDYKIIFDEIIEVSLERGDKGYKEKYDIQNILDNLLVMYTYDFSIKTEEAERIFGIKGFEQIKEYDALAVTLEGEKIGAIFINTNTQESYEASININELNAETLENIYAIGDIQSRDYYFVASEQKVADKFNKNTFLPTATNEQSFLVDKIIAKNPLEKAGGILLNESEAHIDVYFENPAVKTSSFINGTYTFNDENVVVKYYTNGVLEYTNYKNPPNTKNETPYDIAVEFLNKDTNIKNEIYLKDYSLEEGKVIFYFDYKINDFSIVLSENMKKQTGMRAMIEVEVTGSSVSNYKKLIYDFDTTQEQTEVNENYTDVIEKLESEGALQEEKGILIDKMGLEYIFEEVDEPIDVNWKIDIAELYYIKPVNYGE